MDTIYKLTAHEIREMYDKKEITVPEVTKAFLEYIKEQPTKYLISFINKAINGVKNGQ